MSRNYSPGRRRPETEKRGAPVPRYQMLTPVGGGGLGDMMDVVDTEAQPNNQIMCLAERSKARRIVEALNQAENRK